MSKPAVLHVADGRSAAWTVIVFEVVTIWQVSERPPKQAFFGVSSTQP
jgi:hypothetical protein